MNPNNWPATKIEMRPIDALINYARNSRKHSDAQIDKVAASIREFGWTIPILIDEDNTIIAGHCRVLSAKKLNITEVPVMVAKGWSEAQRRAYVISDNQLTLMSEWDEDILKLELMDLKAKDFDLGLTGFDSKELDLLLKEEPVITESEVSEESESELDALIAKYGTQHGQVWQIGKHRLAIGDCTDEVLVDSLLKGDKPQVLFTSPPYWIGLEYEQEENWEDVIALMERFTKVYASRIAIDGRIIINTGLAQAKHIAGGDAHVRLLIDSWQKHFEQQGWLLRYLRFWMKGGSTIYHTNPDFDCIESYSTEFIGYFYNPKAKKFRGAERLGEPWCGKSCWDDILGASKKKGHVAPFPVELVARNLQLFTRKGEVVMEPFGGSGTTIVACEQLGRIGRSTELNEGYAALSLERFVNELKLEPKLL